MADEQRSGPNDAAAADPALTFNTRYNPAHQAAYARAYLMLYAASQRLKAAQSAEQISNGLRGGERQLTSAPKRPTISPVASTRGGAT